MQDLINISREVFDAFNNRDFDRIVSLSSDKLEWIDLPTGKKLSGQQALKQWCQAWVGAFSNAKVEMISDFGSDELVCSEYIGRGQHTGQLVLGQQTLPPSNRMVQIQLCNVVRIQGGKIVSGHAYYDLLTMIRQLGVEPARIAA